MQQNNSPKYFRTEKRKRLKQPVASGKVEEAVLETLSYRSVFNYPMSFYQLSTFLLTKRKIPARVLRSTIRKLVRENKISKSYGKYYLAGIKAVAWKKRLENSQSLLEKAQVISKILAKIPWISFIGVTGSVAASNATRADDIDLFIVARTHRLWITRGFVFAVLKILGELRTDETPNKKICPNIFVDDSSLAWHKKGRNVYVAHEIAMLHPLFDRDGAYFRFLKENVWAFRFFGNQQEPLFELKPTRMKGNRLVNVFEKLAYGSQLAYMKDKKTKEVTNPGVIHFNKTDNTERILSGFENMREKSRLPSV